MKKNPSNGGKAPPKFIRISHLTKVKKNHVAFTCMYKKERIVLNNKQQIKNLAG